MLVLWDGQSPVLWDGYYLYWDSLPPPPVPIFTGVFTPAVQPAAVWTFAVGPGASSASPGPVRELTQARGRVLTRRVGGHHFAQFSLSGSVGGSDPAAEEAAEIELRKSDLWVYRNGVLVHRGRLVSQQVQVDATRWVRTYQSIDYRGMLLHYARFKSPVPSWTNEDQAQIAWEMVEHRQAQTGGNWGITEGVGNPAGQTRTETDLSAGKSIGEAIDAIARRANGFDWEISPDLELNTWTPRRERDNGVVLDYGGNVAEFSGVSPDWANDVIYTGSPETTPVNATADDVATDERGLWSVYGSSPNTSLQASLDDAADGLLADAVTTNHEWTVRLKPGRWGGDDELTLGDIVTLRLRPVGFEARCRVVEMLHLPGENGVESVSLLVREEEPEVES